MTHEEFVTWLDDEVAGGRASAAQRDDLLSQKQRFDEVRETIEREYRARVVGYVADGRHVANAVQDLIATASASYPGRMLYFEPIDFDLF